MKPTNFLVLFVVGIVFLEVMKKKSLKFMKEFIQLSEFLVKKKLRMLILLMRI